MNLALQKSQKPASVANKHDVAETVPFRAVDLLQASPTFRRESALPSWLGASDSGALVPPLELGGADAEIGGDTARCLGYEQQSPMLFGSEHYADSRTDVLDVQSEESVEIVEPPAHFVDEHFESASDREVTAPRHVWDEMVSSSFAQFRQTNPMLLYPWETGPLADIFNFQQDPLPLCPGLAEMEAEPQAGQEARIQQQLQRFLLDSAKYVHAVKSVQDLSYFDAKSQKLELACGQWLNLLAIDGSASGVGPQHVKTLQRDHTGEEAFIILKACFGAKSPATLLKRSCAFRRYVAWFNKHAYADQQESRPFPLDEVCVWEYFLWLRIQRNASGKGFTVPASFLEAVRFAKFTLDLFGTDSVLGSRRLLGFAALERQAMGPTRQAPGMQIEHLRRLHDILNSDANRIDRLGAGCFLLCTYGRARWSDLRYIERVEIEPRETLTLYTAEHKTAAVGLRRQQYLPIVIPWEGIVSDNWVETFLQLYSAAGLDIDAKPLGPLLPAPRVDGTFCARPLSTSEAAEWLRGLLEGTSDSGNLRSHSMKATLLGWCAQAGLDKKSRAVLGHHCSAVSGSEVVYSRQLQTRALRKLGHILRRVRSGLSLEDSAMRDFGLVSTPAPCTPAGAAKTPLPTVPGPTAEHGSGSPHVDSAAVAEALESAAGLEELQSAKEELLDNEMVESAADRLTLYPVEVVAAGVVQIDSSSGSDSTSSSYDSESSVSHVPAKEQSVRYTETIPQGVDFYRHAKNGIVHKCQLGSQVSSCKLNMSGNYKKLERMFHVKLPKCLRCFPKDSNRIRNLDQLSQSLDSCVKRARASENSEKVSEIIEPKG